MKERRKKEKEEDIIIRSLARLSPVCICGYMEKEESRFSGDSEPRSLKIEIKFSQS